MSQPRMTVEERKNYLKKFFYKQKLEDETQRLENKIYRKSFFFISSWLIRLSFVLLFAACYFFYDSSSGFQDEVVINKSVDHYQSGGRYSSRRKTTLHIETLQGEYNFTVGNMGTPEFFINDTVQIERSIFGKPIYFTKHDWMYKFPIDVHYYLYCMVLVFTVITLFLNDGDYYTKQIIKATMAVNIFAVIMYLFL